MAREETLTGPDPVEGGWRAVPTLDLPPILAAALDAFREHGYHGTSVRDIARRVGVTVPALYYHYANKEALLLALLDRITQDFLQRALAADAEAGDDPRRRLAYVVESIVIGRTRQLGLAALESEIRYLTAENRARQTATRDQVEQVLREIVAAGVSNGDFDVVDEAEVVRAILGLCHSVLAWFRPDGELGPEEVAERYGRIALQMVTGASSTQVDRPPA